MSSGDYPISRVGREDVWPPQLVDQHGADGTQEDWLEWDRHGAGIVSRSLPRRKYWHLRGVVAFYRTPLGAHFLQVTPKIQDDTRAAAQSWATDIAVALTRSGEDSQGAQASAPAPRAAAAAQADLLPPSFWEEARRRLSNEDDLLRLWTPAYAHQLNDAEIRGLIRFYRSPVGARFVAALPAIQAECLTAVYRGSMPRHQNAFDTPTK